MPEQTEPTNVASAAPPSGESRAPEEPQLTARQAEIVDAASQVFAERGYSGASMREIAARIGVSEPALYRHFPGKQALFVTMVRVVGGRARREGIALIDAVTTGNVRPALIDALGDRRRAIRTFAPVLRAAANAAASDPAVLAEFRAVVALPVIERLTAKAAEIDAALGVPDADASRDARVRALLALLVGTMLTSLALGDTPDEAVADAAMRVMRWE